MLPKNRSLAAEFGKPPAAGPAGRIVKVAAAEDKPAVRGAPDRARRLRCAGTRRVELLPDVLPAPGCDRDQPRTTPKRMAWLKAVVRLVGVVPAHHDGAIGELRQGLTGLRRLRVLRQCER